MNSDLLTFVTAHGTLLIVAGTILVALGIIQWRRVREIDLELSFKRELLEHGMSLGEAERWIGARMPRRKGLIEQFAALSGGTKAGLIIAFVITFTITLSAITTAIHTHVFWSSVHQQRLPPG